MQAFSVRTTNCGSFCLTPRSEFGVRSYHCAGECRRTGQDFEGNVLWRKSRTSNLLLVFPRLYLDGAHGGVPSMGALECSWQDGLSCDESGIETTIDSTSTGRSEISIGKGSIRDHQAGYKGPRIDVRALARSLHSAKTAEDVEEVLRDKGIFDLRVYSSMIKGFGWDKKLDCALALVEWLKRKQKEDGNHVGPNLFIYNSLLGSVKQSEEYQATEKILSDMLQEGIAPNVITYNTLMAIYVDQGEPQKALELLDKMPSENLYPSAATYSTALLAYRRTEDGIGAILFFAKLKEKHHKGEICLGNDDDWEIEFPKLENFTIRVCYQVMRRWLVKNENLTANVLKLLIEMDKTGLQPSRTDHERLVWACTREEHHRVARELYDRIRENNGEISLSVCNHVIWLMGKAKKWWAALEIYEEMLDKGPQPNNLSYELIVSHFNVLLAAARKRGTWKWGVRLLNKMEDKGLKPGSREWNAVLVACSKAAETTAAVQIFRRMIEQGERPTIVSYGALLSALEKGKLYDEAIRVWEHMLKVGVKPNVYAYTTMASVLSSQRDFAKVDVIVQEMTASAINPTVVTYNAIISSCARNSLSGAAYEWFHRMRLHHITPNEITYEMLIDALVKDGKPRLAYDIYLKSRNDDLGLSSKAYDTVLESCQTHGATIDVSSMGPRPPDKEKKIEIRKTLTEFCKLADVPRRGKPFDRREIYSSNS